MGLGDIDPQEAHIRTLATMMGADGRIDDAELELLFKIADRMGVRVDELDDLHKPDVVVLPTAQQRRDLLADMIKMARSDGQIDSEEQRLIDLTRQMFDLADKHQSSHPKSPPSAGRATPKPKRAIEPAGRRLLVLTVGLALLVAGVYWIFIHGG